MRRYLKDVGLVLKKKKLLKDNQYVTILTRGNGKITLLGYGVRKLLSRRLAHLETGNYISFTFYQKGDYFILSETEMTWGFSKIKKSETKLRFMFLLFFILDRIVPENQVETVIFEKTLQLLTQLNNRTRFTIADLSRYLKEILLIAGFIDKKQSDNISFDSINFIEHLIDRKISWAYLKEI